MIFQFSQSSIDLFLMGIPVDLNVIDEEHGDIFRRRQKLFIVFDQEKWFEDFISKFISQHSFCIVDAVDKFGPGFILYLVVHFIQTHLGLYLVIFHDSQYLLKDAQHTSFSLGGVFSLEYLMIGQRNSAILKERELVVEEWVFQNKIVFVFVGCDRQALS